jgi:hypothetical protein
MLSEGNVFCIKLCLCYEDVWWNGGVIPLILTPITGYRWVVSFILRPLLPRGKDRAQYPCGMRIWWGADAVWTLGRTGKVFLLPEIGPQFIGCPSRRLFHISILSWAFLVLSFPSSLQINRFFVDVFYPFIKISPYICGSSVLYISWLCLMSL